MQKDDAQETGRLTQIGYKKGDGLWLGGRFYLYQTALIKEEEAKSGISSRSTDNYYLAYNLLGRRECLVGYNIGLARRRQHIRARIHSSKS